MARILVYTPTYDDRLQDETVSSIEAFRFNGELDWVLSDDNPYPGRDMRNVVHQFRKGWSLAIDGNYDGLLLVEHDMIVPEDAPQKLWDTDADVVYGCYQLRHKMYSVNLFQYVGKNNIGMSLSMYPRELQAARRKGWTEVSGAGFGCLLIKRPVFTHVAIRDAGNAPDLPFATDCVKRGYRQIGRTDVECGHIDLDWEKRVLWPFENGDFGMIARCLALQTANVRDGDDTVAIKKGRYYTLSVAGATELQRAGFVRITNEADEAVEEEAATNPAAERRETADAKRKTTRRKKGVMSTKKDD